MKTTHENLQDIEEAIEEDWRTDCQGYTFLDYNRFTLAWFVLADQWTDSISAEEYSKFLEGIYEKLTIWDEDLQKRRWKEYLNQPKGAKLSKKPLLHGTNQRPHGVQARYMVGINNGKSGANESGGLLKNASPAGKAGAGNGPPRTPEEEEE